MAGAIRTGGDGFRPPGMELPAKPNETTGRMQAPPFLVDCPQWFFRDGPGPKPVARGDTALLLASDGLAELFL